MSADPRRSTVFQVPVEDARAGESSDHGTDPAALPAVDPTRIDIAVDPTRQRMVGVSAHGLHEFDVPYVSPIADNLWLGGCEDGLVLPEFIQHLVSLYPWERYEVRHQLQSRTEVRMLDSVDQGFEQVDELATWVNECRRTGPVLVHCQAGLNRSSLVAARALMLDGATADEAITTIRERRSPVCLCNPSFEHWLREHDDADHPDDAVPEPVET